MAVGLFGRDELADEDLGQRREHGRDERGHGADGLDLGGRIDRHHRQTRREDDEHADQPDDDGGDAKDADGFAKEHRREDHGQKRGGVAERRDLGQGQEAERDEAHDHGRGAHETAPDVAHRVFGVEAVTEVSGPDHPGDDHRHGEERAEKHRLAGRDPGRHVFHADGHQREDRDRQDLEADAAQRVGGGMRGHGAAPGMARPPR